MNGQPGMPLAPELALFALAVLVLIAGIVKPGRAIGWLAFTGLLAILGLLLMTPEGAVLFGGIEALIPRISAAGIEVPQYFMLMTPYVATLIVLIYVGLVRRTGSEAPAALGLAYVREDRR